MSTYKELVYMVLDELKLISDDSLFTEDHVLFTLNKYRALVLNQRYADIKRQINESNYQTICEDLTTTTPIEGLECSGGVLLRSLNRLPNTMSIGNKSVYPESYMLGTNIALVSKDRFKFVGYNKYMQNIVYATIIDNYLYLNSNNPQLQYLNKVRVTAIFEDAVKASELSCNKDSDSCDIMDKEFPLEMALVPAVLEMTMKELAGPSWRPADTENNATDDLSKLAQFLARNAKSNLQKAIQDD